MLIFFTVRSVSRFISSHVVSIVFFLFFPSYHFFLSFFYFFLEISHGCQLRSQFTFFLLLFELKSITLAECYFASHAVFVFCVFIFKTKAEDNNFSRRLNIKHTVVMSTHFESFKQNTIPWNRCVKQCGQYPNGAVPFFSLFFHFFICRFLCAKNRNPYRTVSSVNVLPKHFLPFFSFFLAAVTVVGNGGTLAPHTVCVQHLQCYRHWNRARSIKLCWTDFYC